MGWEKSRSWADIDVLDLNNNQDDVIINRDRGVGLRKVRSSVIVTSGPSQRVSAWAEKEALGGPHWRIQTLNGQSFHPLSSIFEDLLCARQDSRLWGCSNDKVSLLKGLHFCAKVQRLMMGEWIDGWIHRYSHIERYTWNKFRRL